MIKKLILTLTAAVLVLNIFTFAEEDLNMLQNISNGLVELVKKAQPSVVTITSEKEIKLERQPVNPFFGPDFWHKFFDMPENYKQESLGSGVIINKEGYILTNYHVVADADNIKVYTIDDTEFEAEIIGTDSGTDIALIKIEPKDSELIPIDIGNSDKTEVGELVLALGSPFHLKKTVTLGILSAKGRTQLGLIEYENFMQTDAAINPGNSGGALVNMKGQLIGLNSAIISRSGGNQGIGLAIPVNLAMKIKEDLKLEGRVVRGWLGVSIQNITKDMADILGVDTNSGVLISQVLEGSPAEKGGIERGDIVIGFNGSGVKNVDELKQKVAFTQPGKTAEIEILRNGKKKELDVEIGEKEQKESITRTSIKDKKLGVTIRDLTPALAEEYGHNPEETGVIIVNIEPDSPLASPDIALKKGDLVKEIIFRSARNIIHDKKTYLEVIDKINSGDNFAFLIKREGNTSYVPIKMP